MKTRVLGILVLVALFISCSKNNDINVTLKTDGNLSVIVTDNSANLIANAKVKLYDYSVGGDYFDALITDTKGKVSFNKINAGTYSVVIDTPKVSGIKYMPNRTVQVVSGASKEISINIQEYVGSIVVTVKKPNYLGNGPFSGLNTLVVPIDLYNSSYTVSTLISKAEFTGKTDTQGKITFSVPSSRDFQLIFYNDRKTKKNAIESFNLEKDEILKLSYSIDTSLIEAARK